MTTATIYCAGYSTHKCNSSVIRSGESYDEVENWVIDTLKWEKQDGILRCSFCAKAYKDYKSQIVGDGLPDYENRIKELEEELGRASGLCSAYKNRIWELNEDVKRINNECLDYMRDRDKALRRAEKAEDEMKVFLEYMKFLNDGQNGCVAAIDTYVEKIILQAQAIRDEVRK